jgi:hypothetical protein
MGVIPINFGVEAEVFVRQQRNMSRYVNELVIKWGINDATAISDAPTKQIIASLLHRLSDVEGIEQLRIQLLNFMEGNK